MYNDGLFDWDPNPKWIWIESSTVNGKWLEVIEDAWRCIKSEASM